MVLDVSPVETHGRASLQFPSCVSTISIVCLYKFPPHVSTFFRRPQRYTKQTKKNPPEHSEGFSVNRMETIR